ncbi:hypothetical protein Prede_0963 [Prevotella dentalis DSM 3688]|uniref:Uncharacterized protein n=1 Tax=Prevotella dentalis (strain ATCC 49559 / DSM 3688 / JCM 13448 / NCTC 12043 / ES 2772) TaxID=908937 RepID=L0JAL4_PREDD|nr:hypothetical protein Prede_0963 [Prevotella dentalis DSM 3688]
MICFFSPPPRIPAKAQATAVHPVHAADKSQGSKINSCCMPSTDNAYLCTDIGRNASRIAPKTIKNINKP